MLKPGISWVLLVTDQYAKSFAFYKDILHFQVERELPKEEFCQFSLGNCFLAIYGRSFLEMAIPAQYLSQPGGAIYSLPDSDDIDHEVAELKARGVVFIKEPQTQPWGQRTAYFTDPDGHIWEVQQWLK